MIDLNISQERLKSLQKNIHNIASLGGMNSLLRNVVSLTARQARARIDKIMAKELGVKQKSFKGRKSNPIAIVLQQSENTSKASLIIGGKGFNLSRFPYQQKRGKKHLIHYFNEKSKKWVSELTDKEGIISKIGGKKIISPNGFEMKGRGGNILLFERINQGFGWDKIRPLTSNKPLQILQQSGRMKELEDYTRKRFEMNVKPAVRCTIAKLKNEPAQGCF
jgi:hypothetical protein